MSGPCYALHSEQSTSHGVTSGKALYIGWGLLPGKYGASLQESVHRKNGSYGSFSVSFLKLLHTFHPREMQVCLPTPCVRNRLRQYISAAFSAEGFFLQYRYRVDLYDEMPFKGNATFDSFFPPHTISPLISQSFKPSPALLLINSLDARFTFVFIAHYPFPYKLQSRALTA